MHKYAGCALRHRKGLISVTDAKSGNAMTCGVDVVGFQPCQLIALVRLSLNNFF
jgi:hypothetical protein